MADKYWLDRALQSRKIVDKLEATAFERFNSILTNNIKIIDKQINAFDLDNKNELLSLRRTNEIKQKLKEAATDKDKYLTELYKKDAKLYRISRLEGLKADMQIQLSLSTASNEKDLFSFMVDVGQDTNAFNLETARQSLGLNLNAISKTAIETLANTSWIGSGNYSSKIWADRYLLGKNLDIIFKTDFVQGKSLQSIAKKVKDKFGTSAYNAMRLARTEATRIHSQSDLLFYKDVNADKYEYHAYLDSKTSDICQSLDGQVFLTSNAQIGVNLPPMHPNCRSTTVPFIDYESLAKKYGLDIKDFK